MATDNPLNLPVNVQEVQQRIQTDVQNALPESNPFLPNSLLNALITGLAGSNYDLYLQIGIALQVIFPDTATGIYLERWGSWVGISRLPATIAQGTLVCTGTIGTNIPALTNFVSSTSNIYTSNAAAVISLVSINITTLSRVGGLVTAVTATEHGFATGQTVTIVGAGQPEYNGPQVIIVVSPTEFEYTIATTPLTPATGTITAVALMASVPVQSQALGTSQNAPSGDQFTVQTPISGLNNTAIANYFGIGGGSNVESDAAFRERVQFRYQNPVSLFNVNAIILQAKTVPGVTRVWVYEITPAPGFVTIYFVRDGDPSIIPGPAQILEVYNALLEIKPANTPPNYMIVDAPTPVIVDFEFSALNPNTPTMQSAITASLEAFFIDSTNVGVSVPEDAYRCAIFSTIDPATGQSVQSFSLIMPPGDISVGMNELSVLGSITYP